MNRKEQLVNIYIKIYNKRPLTMDDLTFLSKYDPECFNKTCQNLVYNVPETKKLMQPETKSAETQQVSKQEKTVSSTGNVDVVLENLKKMEMKELPVKSINSENVKNLLGNLYMEMLYPHNDKARHFKMQEETEASKFNRKV